MGSFATAVRALLRRPGFLAVAVLPLMLAIAAATAVFSVAYPLLVRPLPYQDPDRLLIVWEDASKYGFPHDTPAVANYFDWKARARSFQSMAAITGGNLSLTGAGQPELIKAASCTADLLGVLGTRPLLGRAFLPGEDQDSAGRVAMISHRLWQSRFGGDPNVIGRVVRLDLRPTEIVGVLPPEFAFPDRTTDILAPFAWTPEERANRHNHFLIVVGRLAPRATVAAADAEIKTIAAQLAADHPDENANLGANVMPLREHLTGSVRPALVALCGAVGFVLLVALANVVNLLLVRLTTRRNELAVRRALGAGAANLRSLLLAEAAVVTGLGAGAGIALGAGIVRAVTPFLPKTVTDAASVTVGWPIIGAAVAVALLALVVLALVPTGDGETAAALREGNRSVVGARRRLQDSLVVAEVALSLCLLVAAGLTTRTLSSLLALRLGFEPGHALSIETVVSNPAYAPLEERTAFFRRILERVRALPGVQSAGYTSHLPFECGCDNTSVLIDGQPTPLPGSENIVSIRVVTPGYFEALGSPLVRGRDLRDGDTSLSEPVVLVNESFVARYLKGQEALGHGVRAGTGGDPKRTWAKVAGIVPDIRQSDMTIAAKPEMYIPQAQFAGFYFTPKNLVVRTSVTPQSLADAVTREVHAVDPEQPVSAVMPLGAVLGDALASQRLQMSVFGGFAVVTWILAAVGLYGVIAYRVARRTREFGLRMAMGATAPTLRRLVVADGLRLAGLGVVLGLAAAAVLARFISSLLYGVKPNDPLTLAAMGAAMLASAVIACVVPAIRAGRLDPVDALREE